CSGSREAHASAATDTTRHLSAKSASYPVKSIRGRRSTRMDIHTKWSWLAVLLGAACLGVPLAPHASAQAAVFVGRIAHTDGQVLRFVPDTQDWVATVQDAPFGLHDTLYADPSARAELIMPNGLWVRIGTSTQIQLIALTSDASEFDLASGVARFY